MIFKKKRDFSFLSLEKQKTVRGIVVKKAPLGKYLQMMELLHDFPLDVFSVHFAEMSVSEILDRVKALDAEMIKAFLDILFIKAPDYLVGALSCILDVEEERLLDDLEIGPVGLFELIEAVIEVNSLGKLINLARLKLMGMKNAVTTYKGL